MKSFVSVFAFSIVLSFLAVLAAERETPLHSNPDIPLLTVLLDLDRPLYDRDTLERARTAALRLTGRVDSCNEASGKRGVECALEAVLHGITATPLSDPQVETSTVTAALIHGRGTCAALVAVALALTAHPEPLFEAVVLREHVLLGTVDGMDRYFETIEAGRRLSGSDLYRYKPWPPGGPVRVKASDYPAYYADNIAVRLANAGQSDLARQFFEESISIAPSAARVRFNFGTFLLGTERYTEAEAELARAIRLGWKDAPAFVNRGAARWQLGRLKAAERDFRKALKLAPENREAAVNLRRLESDTCSPSSN